jgi:hypothetical protein
MGDRGSAATSIVRGQGTTPARRRLAVDRRDRRNRAPRTRPPAGAKLRPPIPIMAVGASVRGKPALLVPERNLRAQSQAEQTSSVHSVPDSGWSMINRDCFVRLILLFLERAKAPGPSNVSLALAWNQQGRTSPRLIPHTVELDQKTSSGKALQPQGTTGRRAVPLVGPPGKAAGSIPRRGGGPCRAHRSGAAGE